MSKKRSNTRKRGGKGQRKLHHHHHALHGTYAAHPTHDRLIHTAVETGKDILGVIVGGVVGAAIGKSSLLVGIAVTGVGHYVGNRLVQVLGTGMMASNGFQGGTSGTNGLGGTDTMKDRLTAYQHSFSEKFYLDKFLKKKPVALPAAAGSTSGFGDVQYFTYPDALTGDLAALNDIENQLAESALTFQGGQAAGDLPEMSDTFPEIASPSDGSEDFGDPDQPVGEMEDQLVGEVEDPLY
ncbi:hypothetical protein [Dinghuibacter silviterrae]|uniref:Uncharacterized protein n=1 Tax=Dinghuibacter silviterrae TaxID=1539049 RepID=A0A4R8DT82_9BACT|nr:hypothetical protein [Dinghuibacter silviterrae]TDX01480.1 hypothetical protein EDB95_2516 [Dinghuibacter silviterrae]